MRWYQRVSGATDLSTKVNEIGKLRRQVSYLKQKASKRRASKRSKWVAVQTETFVYYIREVNGEGRVKIGVSQNPTKRLGDIQVCNASELELHRMLGPMSRLEAYAVERNIHAAAKQFRIRGEWFSSEVL